MSHKIFYFVFSFISVALVQQLCAEDKPLTIALIGDSTVTQNAGWGKAFASRFGDGVTVVNFAASGRSSKSWYDESRLPKALESKPDYVFIQFGHNGQPGKGDKRETDPATSYRDYLRIYINAFKEIGAKPILVSSVSRRTFDPSGKVDSSLTPWAEAAKEVAEETGIGFIDLHRRSIELYTRIGQVAAMEFNPRDEDVTHFNKKGAEAVTDLIVEELKTVSLELFTRLK
jgi:pectinesterase